MRVTAPLNFGYIPDISCRVITIPFDEEEQSMVIFLPNNKNGLVELEISLSENLDNIWSLMKSYLSTQMVDLSIPFFKINSYLKVKDLVKWTEIKVDSKGRYKLPPKEIEQSEPLPVDFTANYPFIFLVANFVNESIQLIGRLETPIRPKLIKL